MEIEYRVNGAMSVGHFAEVLERSGLGERRPMDDTATLERMVRHANLTVTAWAGDRLVGVARSVTDFSYCCYLSDLAVDREFQGRGIGKELIRRTQGELGARCKLILLSAPAAVDYYPKLGFEKHPQAWVLGRKLE